MRTRACTRARAREYGPVTPRLAGVLQYGYPAGACNMRIAFCSMPGSCNMHIARACVQTRVCTHKRKKGTPTRMRARAHTRTHAHTFETGILRCKNWRLWPRATTRRRSNRPARRRRGAAGAGSARRRRRRRSRTWGGAGGGAGSSTFVSNPPLSPSVVDSPLPSPPSVFCLLEPGLREPVTRRVLRVTVHVYERFIKPPRARVAQKWKGWQGEIRDWERKITEERKGARRTRTER